MSATDPTPEPDQPAPPEQPPPQEFGHRVAPRYGSFIFTGVVLGAIATAIFYWPARDRYSTDGILGYVGGIFLILGALLGAGVALWLERGRNRRSGRR